MHQLQNLPRDRLAEWCGAGAATVVAEDHRGDRSSPQTLTVWALGHSASGCGERRWLKM